tara:strand:- start:2328 stop:3806 length:1479 start_codon:yes stop_codon:yes gene_type:complete
MKIQIKNVSKNFPGIKALNKVNFNLNHNSIHALIGENGAGKSTLVKIINGFYCPDEGEIFINDKKIIFNNPKDAIKKGISLIHQEAVMFEELSVMENMYVGNHLLKKNNLIDWNNIKKKAIEILDYLESNIKYNDKVKDLSIAQKHLVQISRSFVQKSDIVIMDEPTAALSQKEIKELYKIILNLKKQNKSIIFISHKLDEVLEICDEFTVLRDGRKVISNLIKNTNKNDLISYMVGRKIDKIFPKKYVNLGAPILKVKNLSKKNQFKNINFDLRKKEILGFYGLVGSGRTEIMQTIFGINNFDSGNILFNETPFQAYKPIEAIKKGIVYLSEERQNLGIFAKMSVKDNLVLTTLEQISRTFIRNELKEQSMAINIQEKLNIKISYWNQLVENLSGGNQQKTVIGKWLATKPKILILDEPTKGIDIASKSSIHKFMGELVNQGMTIILVSSELPEIMGMCDRVVVLYKGLIRSILDITKTSSEEILTYASGE